MHSVSLVRVAETGLTMICLINICNMYHRGIVIDIAMDIAMDIVMDIVERSIEGIR